MTKKVTIKNNDINSNNKSYSKNNCNINKINNNNI